MIKHISRSPLLSPSLSLSLCLSLSLSVSLSVFLSVSLSVSLCLPLCLPLSLCLSLARSVCLVRYWQKFFPLKAAKNLEAEGMAQYCSPYHQIEVDVQRIEVHLFGYRSMLGIFTMLSFWHMLEYLAVFPRIVVPVQAIARALPAIFSFFLVFLVILVGFAFFFTSYCGTLPEFKSFGRALFTLAEISAGDYDVKPTFRDSQYGAYAELMVLFFRIITIMILLNIFIVIVMEKYADVKDEQPYIQEEFAHQIKVATNKAASLFRCSFRHKHGEDGADAGRLASKKAPHQAHIMAEVMAHHHHRHKAHLQKQNKVLWKKIRSRFKATRASTFRYEERFNRIELALERIAMASGGAGAGANLFPEMPPVALGDDMDWSSSSDSEKGSGTDDEKVGDKGKDEKAGSVLLNEQRVSHNLKRQSFLREHAASLQLEASGSDSDVISDGGGGNGSGFYDDDETHSGSVRHITNPMPNLSGRSGGMGNHHISTPQMPAHHVHPHPARHVGDDGLGEEGDFDAGSIRVAVTPASGQSMHGAEL